MTGDRKSAFAKRPGGDPDAWVRAAETQTHAQVPTPAEAFTARLTIDVTPVMRGRIKIVAFRRGLTVADLLRSLFAREFPDEGGAA